MINLLSLVIIPQALHISIQTQHLTTKVSLVTTKGIKTSDNCIKGIELKVS